MYFPRRKNAEVPHAVAAMPPRLLFYAFGTHNPELGVFFNRYSRFLREFWRQAHIEAVGMMLAMPKPAQASGNIRDAPRPNQARGAIAQLSG